MAGIRRYNNVLYKVRVPVVATYTEDEMELFGLPTMFKDKKEVKNSYMDLTIVMLKMTRLIDIYSQGFPIHMVNESDVPILYEEVQSYIEDIKYGSQYSPNSVLRDERYLEIDRFASEMFDGNKATILKDQINAPSGFTLGIDYITAPSTIHNANDVSYINNNLPEIDMSKIFRQRDMSYLVK